MVTHDMNIDVDALILAAGDGKRLGLGPKALLKLNGQTLVEHVAHLAQPFVNRVVVGTQPALIETCQSLLPWTTVVPGGKTRQETLNRLIQQSSASHVLVFDAARPFPTPKLVRKILHEASQQDAVIPCIPSPVPNIVFSGSPNALVSIPSHQLRIIQSPQAYRRERLLQIYELAAQHGWQFQTTVELMHAAQQATTIVPGEENNIKITMPLDWQIAEKILFALLKPQPV